MEMGRGKPRTIEHECFRQLVSRNYVSIPRAGDEVDVCTTGMRVLDVPVVGIHWGASGLVTIRFGTFNDDTVDRPVSGVPFWAGDVKATLTSVGWKL